MAFDSSTHGIFSTLNNDPKPSTTKIKLEFEPASLILFVSTYRKPLLYTVHPLAECVSSNTTYQDAFFSFFCGYFRVELITEISDPAKMIVPSLRRDLPMRARCESRTGLP